MLRKLFLIQIGIYLFCLPVIGHAYYIAYNPGTTYETSEIISTATGADMAGMSVTAVLEGGITESLTWGDLGGGIYGVNGTGWSLTSTGDTPLDPVDPYNGYYIFGTWTLQSTGAAIDSIDINGEPGNIVFDIWPGGDDALIGDGSYGTNGSLYGLYPTTINWVQDPDLIFNYYNQVTLIGESPVGDLYRNLEINFRSVLFQNASMEFQSDTDRYVGGLNPVPEPSTIFLLGSGLIGLAGLGRKKFRK